MAAEENGKKDKLNNAKKTRVIPGYHLTLGIVIAMLSLIVLIPLASVLVSSLNLSPGEFWHLLLKKNVLNAFKTSIGCSFIAAVVNTVFGLIIAWTLVKYDFPGKKILDGFIELPFCLPTAVAGITLSRLYSEDGFLGKPLAALGIDVAYTKIGLTIALVFVGIPFVIRAVQPILEKMDNQYEEAAYMLGATPRRTFFKVIRQRYRRIRKCHLHIGKQRKGADAGHIIRDHAEAQLHRLCQRNSHSTGDADNIICTVVRDQHSTVKAVQENKPIIDEETL